MLYSIVYVLHDCLRKIYFCQLTKACKLTYRSPLPNLNAFSSKLFSLYVSKRIKQVATCHVCVYVYLYGMMHLIENPFCNSKKQIKYYTNWCVQYTPPHFYFLKGTNVIKFTVLIFFVSNDLQLFLKKILLPIHQKIMLLIKNVESLRKDWKHNILR